MVPPVRNTSGERTAITGHMAVRFVVACNSVRQRVHHSVSLMRALTKNKSEKHAARTDEFVEEFFNHIHHKPTETRKRKLSTLDRRK